MRTALVVFLILMRSACVAGQDSLPASRPNTDEAALIAAAEESARYSEAHGGQAMLVMFRGKRIFERYTATSGVDVGHFLASGTKSFSGVMAMAAVEDGIIGLDDRVADVITEWKGDPRKEKITVRHLLSLTSGLLPGNDRLSLPRTRDNYAESLRIPAEADPGVKFRYGPAAFYVFGEYMTRRLAGRFDSPFDYLKKRILDPIGVHITDWRRDPTGHYLMPQGASLTAREWAKFGEFLKAMGTVDGKAVLQKASLKACLTGSTANPAYGLTFWLTKEGIGPAGETFRPVAPGAIDDLFMAAGAFGQRLIVCPSLDLVVVRFADQDAGYTDYRFLAPLGRALGVKTDESETGDLSRPASAPATRPAVTLSAAARRTFERFDKNGDGTIDRDELSPRQARMLMRADRDHDEKLSESEFAEAWDDLRERLRGGD